MRFRLVNDYYCFYDNFVDKAVVRRLLSSRYENETFQNGSSASEYRRTW